MYQKIDTGTNTIILERETLHVMDDAARVAVIDTPTIDTLSTGEVQTLRYQFSNHIGTAALELDDDADVISYEEYYPFGNSSYQGGRSIAECSLKRYRYVGKERDDESGFIYIGARYYCPWLARWLASDPINSEMYNLHQGNPGRNIERQFVELTASSYEYCYANPVRFTDPSGEQPISYVPQQLATNNHLPAHKGTYGGSTLADVTEAKIKKHSPLAAGIYKGTNNFVMHTFEGVVQTVLRPLETVKAAGQAVEAFTPGIGFFSPQSAQIRSAAFSGLSSAVNKFNTGDVTTKTAMVTEGVLTVASLYFGAGEAKGAEIAGDAKYLFRGTTLEGATTQNGLKGRLLIIDENLSPRLGKMLENEGFKVKIFPKGTLDADIIVEANKKNAIVITNNIKDFKGWGTTVNVTENMRKADNLSSFVDVVKKLDKASQANPSLIQGNKNISLYDYWSK